MAAQPPARPPIDEKAAYRELKDLFPYVSRTFLRTYAKHGVAVMSNYLLDNPGRIPETRGDETDDEEEREERRRQAAAYAMSADADADGEARAAQPQIQPAPVQSPRTPAARQPLLHILADDRRLAQLLQGDAARDENVDATPPRKQQRVQQPAAGILQQLLPVQQGAAAVAVARQQPQQQAVAAAAGNEGDGGAAAAESDEEEEAAFVMRPIMPGEKCSGGCNKKPRVTRVFCQDYLELEGKQHTLCVTCLERRDGVSKLRETDDDEPGYVHCPMMRCTHRISMRELAAATRDHAPALHARYAQRVREIAQEARLERRQQQQRQRPLAAVAEEDEDEIFQQQAVAGDANRPELLHQQQQQQVTPRRRYSATPLFDRRLSQSGSQESVTPRRAAPKLSWTPRTRETAAAAQEDEELPVTEEEAEELRETAGFVDREKLKQLEGHFPETAVGWLVRHADYGMETLVDMVTKGKADPKMRERADGRGATTIVKATLRDRKQFECSVCFADYDEHLAITCVFLKKRRDTLLPGQVGPTAAEMAVQRGEEERGRREQHKFCAECVVGHARAAEEQHVILRGGVGIKCMEPRCKNALLRAHIEQVLDMQTRAILDPLLSNEALLAANCNDIEKCLLCPWSVAIQADKEMHPIFECGAKACKHRHCRKCGRPYDDAHKNRTCEELDPEAMRKRVEEQLTEQSMHKCPRCKRGIVKADGCNKIPCPCGQLSCYVCKAAIKDYKHFKNGPAEEDSNKCPLWVDPTKKFEEQRQATLTEQINGAADETIREQLRRLV